MSLRQTRFSRGAINDRKNQEHIRALAVALVDGDSGFTMEFAPSPRAHKDQYDRVEEMLRSALSVNRLRLCTAPNAWR